MQYHLFKSSTFLWAISSGVIAAADAVLVSWRVTIGNDFLPSGTSFALLPSSVSSRVFCEVNLESLLTRCLPSTSSLPSDKSRTTEGEALCGRAFLVVLLLTGVLGVREHSDLDLVTRDREEGLGEGLGVVLVGDFTGSRGFLMVGDFLGDRDRDRVEVADCDFLGGEELDLEGGLVTLRLGSFAFNGVLELLPGCLLGVFDFARSE